MILSAVFIALAVVAKGNIDTKEDASKMSDQALQLLKSGKYNESISLYEKVIRIQEVTIGSEHPITANSILNLGMAYASIGNYEKSLQLMERGQAINEKTLGFNNESTARGLRNLGYTYQNMGDYKKALIKYEKCLEIRKEMLGMENPDTADALSIIGDVYSDIGDYEKALTYSQKAVAIYEKCRGPDDVETGRAIGCLGTIYFNMGDFKNALPLFLRDLKNREHAKGIVDDPYTAVRLGYLAQIYNNMGDAAKALPLQERALAIFEKNAGAGSPETARQLYGLAKIMISDGKYSDAFSIANKALIIDQKALGNQHPETAMCLRLLVEINILLNNQIEARSIASRWVSSINDQIQQMLTLGETQRLKWASQTLTLSIPVATLKSEKIADVIVRWKAIVLDSLLEDRGLAIRLGKTSGGREALEKIQLLKLQIAKLSTSNDTNNSEKISDLKNEVEKTESLLGSLVNLGVRVRDSSSVSIDQLYSPLVSGDTVVDFVKYYDIKNKYFSYGVSIVNRSGEALWINSGPSDKIDETINAYRKAIASGDEASLKTQIQILSDKFWQPIAAALPPDTKKIYIGADGPLNFLSFATLQYDQGKFLSEKYQIAYVGSGRDLMRLAKPVDKKKMIIYANPIFASVTGLQAKATSVEAKPSVGMSSAELAEFTKVQLPELPGTEQEAATIAQIVKDAQWSDESHLGADASKKGLMAMKAPAILHLATHGFFLGGEEGGGEGLRGMKLVAAPDVPAPAAAPTTKPLKISPMRQSGVALTGGQSTLQAWGRGEFPDPSNDGILTAEEVAGLDLDGTWLVTLSACETGVGQVQSGEGVFGLRRAFMMAGAQNLLMTLWPVSDETTPKIMADFYKKALATGDAAGSLSDVQRDWLVKLRNEKGLLAAVRDAGPFAMVVMANPNSKQSSDTNNPSNNSLQNAQSPSSTPPQVSQDALADCVQKTQSIMDQKIQQNDPSIQENCTAKFKDLLRRGLHVSSDEPVPFLDADFRCDTQDDYPKVNSTGPATQNGDKISVPVELQSGKNAPFTKTWVFAQENGSWLLDDVLTQKSGESAAKSMADELSKLPRSSESASPSIQSSTVTSPARSSGGSPAILEFQDALAKADAGDAYAQGVVSIYYTMGYKVPKDTAKGLTYALKSAAQKNPLGIYQVGALRVLGVGMKKDKAQGRKLMSEAFDGLNTLSGDPYALYDLACMAIEGVGVDQNPKEAARLFKASADMGYAPAQRMFAKFLEAGVGVRKDLEAARQYQSQSSAQWSQQ